MVMKSLRPLVTILLAFACFGPSQSVELSGRTSLPVRRAVVFRAPEPLKVVAARNGLCLEVLSPDSLNYPPPNNEWGIRRSDRVLVIIGAAMLQRDGGVDTLSSASYSMGTVDCLHLGPSVSDSLHPPFVGARITAGDSVAVRRIVWESLPTE
jgi:hypothetical protein